MSAGITEAEPVLGGCVSLFSGQPKPPNGFSIVLRYPSTCAVHQAKARLRMGKTLLSGQPKPPNGFTIALRYAVTVEVPHAQTELSQGVPLFG